MDRPLEKAGMQKSLKTFIASAFEFRTHLFGIFLTLTTLALTGGVRNLFHD